MPSTEDPVLWASGGLEQGKGVFSPHVAPELFSPHVFFVAEGHLLSDFWDHCYPLGCSR